MFRATTTLAVVALVGGALGQNQQPKISTEDGTVVIAGPDVKIRLAGSTEFTLGGLFASVRRLEVEPTHTARDPARALPRPQAWPSLAHPPQARTCHAIWNHIHTHECRAHH